MTAKKIILEYYKSDAFINVSEMDSFLHTDFVLEWHSSKGFLKLNRQESLDFTKEISTSYIETRVAIHSILQEKNQVAVRYSHFIKTMENPREEMLLSHLFAIWEVRDDKLYRCYQMSQLS